MSKNMKYDHIIRQVEAGNVKSVSLDETSSITGALVEGDVTNEFCS